MIIVSTRHLTHTYMHEPIVNDSCGAPSYLSMKCYAVCDTVYIIRRCDFYLTHKNITLQIMWEILEKDISIGAKTIYEDSTVKMAYRSRKSIGGNFVWT